MVSRRRLVVCVCVCVCVSIRGLLSLSLTHTDGRLGGGDPHSLTHSLSLSHSLTHKHTNTQTHTRTELAIEMRKFCYGTRWKWCCRRLLRCSLAHPDGLAEGVARVDGVLAELLSDMSWGEGTIYRRGKNASCQSRPSFYQPNPKAKPGGAGQGRGNAARTSSMRRSWLYLARRSERQGAPVLIWPVQRPTARSAM